MDWVKLRLQSSYGICCWSKARTRFADVRCTKRCGRVKASAFASNRRNDYSHKSGAETFWNHIKTFKVEEKILGFFCYLSIIFIGRVYEITIFACAKFALLCANSDFCVQTHDFVCKLAFCRLFLAVFIDLLSIFLNKTCYNMAIQQ